MKGELIRLSRPKRSNGKTMKERERERERERETDRQTDRQTENSKQVQGMS